MLTYLHELAKLCIRSSESLEYLFYIWLMAEQHSATRYPLIHKYTGHSRSHAIWLQCLMSTYPHVLCSQLRVPSSFICSLLCYFHSTISVDLRGCNIFHNWGPHLYRGITSNIYVGVNVAFLQSSHFVLEIVSRRVVRHYYARSWLPLRILYATADHVKKIRSVQKTKHCS